MADDRPFRPADPSRFTEITTQHQAARLAESMLAAGRPAPEVNEFLRGYGLGLQPVLEVLPGGKQQ